VKRRDQREQWPAELLEFDPEQWQNKDDPVRGCTPTQAQMWRKVFAHRRWTAARMEWAKRLDEPTLPLYIEARQYERQTFSGTETERESA
jgi:hypothetical protein